MNKEIKTVTVTIRLDPELHQRVVQLAEEESRTFNLQVKHLLGKGIERVEAEQEAIYSSLDGPKTKDVMDANA